MKVNQLTNRRSVLTIVALIVLSNALTASATNTASDASTATAAKTLQWKKDYGTAKRAAQSAKRPLLVVIENPTKKSGQIDESTLSEVDRQRIAKARFELVRVNVNTDYGQRVAAAFGATKFPYTAVTDDRSVQIVFRKAGQMSENDWTVALAKSKDTPSPQQVQSASKISSAGVSVLDPLGNQSMHMRSMSCGAT